MYKLTSEFLVKLDQEKVKYEFDTSEKEYDWVGILTIGEHSNNIYLQFYIKEQGDVQIKLFSLCKVKEEKEIEMLRTLNELNRDYRWLTFFIDENSEVTINTDFMVSEDDVRDRCFEMAQMFVDIVDEAYPKIMMTLWK